MENSESLYSQSKEPKDKSPMVVTFQFLGIILRLLGFVIIGSGLAFLTVGLLYNIDVQKVTESGILSLGKDFILALQGFTQLYSFIVLPLLYIFFFKKDLQSIFHFKTPHLGKLLFLAFLIIFFCVPIINWMVDWNKAIELPSFLEPLEKWMQKKELEAKELTETIAFYKNEKEFILGLFVIALLPAVSEELMFRGIIQNEIKEYTQNAHVGIWLSGFLFSFLHLQFYGFFPRMMLGVTFGYLYYWSGSLLIPMVVHFINNGLTFLLLNLYKQKAIELNPESTESIPWYSMVISCIIFGFLLVTFKKTSTEEKEE